MFVRCVAGRPLPLKSIPSPSIVRASLQSAPILATLVVSTLAHTCNLSIDHDSTRSTFMGFMPLSFRVDFTVMHHALSAIWIGKRILPFTTCEFLAPKAVRQPRSCIEKQLRTLKSISAITTLPKPLDHRFPALQSAFYSSPETGRHECGTSLPTLLAT